MDEHKIEEALGIIWKQKELKNEFIPVLIKAIEVEVKEPIFDYLLDNDFISKEKEKDKVKFSLKGEKIAINITRRHRLAERLLHDVLAISKIDMESDACVFEHILSPGVEENICILLGHPRECPHGFNIPEGECCKKAKTIIESIVVPLSLMKSQDSGKVAYMLTHNHPQLHRLMSMGIVPGTDIYIHQIFPSYIIKVGETQLAIEKEIAQDIYIRRR